MSGRQQQTQRTPAAKPAPAPETTPEQELAADEVAELRKEVADLRDEVGELRQALARRDRRRRPRPEQ